jgi:C4-dicarboxylate-specific signal transduction histidine kinase
MRPHLPFIFVSGTLDEEVAIEALKIGATDYVFKTKVSRIVPAVRRALREAEERAERARAEKALRRSESYLVEAQRLSHTGSFGWDVSSGEIRWSEETFRIFGFEPGTTPTDQMIEQRTHPDDRELARRILDSAAQQGKEFDLEHRLLMPDGSIKDVRVVGRPSQNQSEYVGAVTDVTESRRAEAERKQAQEALRATQAQLAHVNRVMTMGELAASIAHEVNQPLSGIVLNGNAGLRWLSSDEPNLVEARESLQRLVRDAHRAGDVIARIRALTRKGTIEKGRLDLNETIEEVVVLARAELQKNRVDLRKELRTDLPAVLGDRIQLQQVVLNLLINGIEAMSAVAGRPRELWVATGDHDPQVVLVTVRDSGVGLDPQGAERIFDAFYTTKPAGMGMGLSISRSIVQNHGGRLWAEANDGPGTTFRFTIPKYR